MSRILYKFDMFNSYYVLKTSYGKKRAFALVLFLTFISLLLIDLFSHIPLLKDPTSIHQLEIIELLIFIVGSIAFLYLWELTKREERSKIHHGEEIKKIQHDCDNWKKKSSLFIEEFQNYIQHHFNIWELSEAEKDVGIFLIKGLTFKEIAAFRNVSEKTIRNQALAIYAKSGLSGRNELAAFFLEELLTSAPKSSQS